MVGHPTQRRCLGSGTEIIKPVPQQITGDMNVSVDKARQDKFVRRVDFSRRRQRFALSGDRLDRSVGDRDIGTV